MGRKILPWLIATLVGLGLMILATGCYVDPGPPPGVYVQPAVVAPFYSPWYWRPYHHYRYWWGRHYWVPRYRDHWGRWRHGHWRRRW
jgi:hypothetical protein